MARQDVPERPVRGPAFLDSGTTVDSVRIVELLGRRRTLVEFPSGSTMIVPDWTLRDSREQ